MDTRSPNKVSAYFLTVVVWLLFACGFCVGLESVMPNNGYIHDNAAVQDEVVRLAKNIQRYYIYYKNFDEDTAVEYLKKLHSRNAGTDTSTAQETPTLDIFGRKVEENENYTERGELNESITGSDDMTASRINVASPEELYSDDINALTADQAAEREKLLTALIENYRSIENYISSMHDLHFYLFDRQRSYCAATNTEDIFNEKYYDYVELSDSIFDEAFNGEALNLSFAKNHYICLISLPVAGLSQTMTSEVNYTYRLYTVNKAISSIYMPVIFYAIGIILLAYLLIYRRSEAVAFREKIFGGYMLMPLSFKVVFTIIIAVYFFRMLMYKNYRMSYLIAGMDITGTVFRVLFTALAMLLLVMAFEHILKYCRRKLHLVDEPEARFLAGCVRDMKIAAKANEQIVFIISLLIMVMWLLPLAPLAIYASDASPVNALFALSMYGIYCLALWIAFKYINNTSKLKYYIREMANGNITAIPEEHGPFSKPINNLNNINAGLKANLEEMIKSERLKTELITNVSHDLKTPLTSIINYLSLLKTLDLDNETAKEYIDIAGDKAKRLNVLIQDLFEASKLNSGQMKLEKMPSDVVSLLKQTLGELDYKISQSGIEFRTELPDHPVTLDMDGQRMWRVFDNLLTNIIKYSPSGSRGYINMAEFDNKVVITFKNISNYPLDFDGAELFERFKRGDVSRSTEGSGLGLSIAKSIVELHGGTLEIIIDGDLFKTIVTLYK